MYKASFLIYTTVTTKIVSMFQRKSQTWGSIPIKCIICNGPLINIVEWWILSIGNEGHVYSGPDNKIIHACLHDTY
jgi:hypothetical protein